MQTLVDDVDITRCVTVPQGLSSGFPLHSKAFEYRQQVFMTCWYLEYHTLRQTCTSDWSQAWRNQDELGKVIRMNQLDATVIYWSIRSAQHVSGNILPIIRSVRLRFLHHMVSCCCGGQGDAHRLPTHHNNRIPYGVKISVSRSWWWAKYCPKHVELIL